MPVVVFVSSIISVLYHVGVMQRVIHVIGWILQKVLDTTAAESMAAAGNIFVGNASPELLYSCKEIIQLLCLDHRHHTTI